MTEANTRPGSRLDAAALMLVTLGTIAGLSIITLSRGQDINWDQLNYHFSSPEAFFRDSLWYNIATSQMETWFNPLAYIPTYWLARHVDSATFKLVLTVIHALNAPLVYLIARRIQPDDDKIGIAFAVLASLLGITAATVLGEAGTTFFDIVSALFVSASLLLILIALDQQGLRPTIMIVAAGLLAGAVVGLKLVNGVYGLALVVAIMATTPWRSALFRAAAFVVAAGIGFVLTAGWWMVFLWRAYGNPLFPYFNSVFRSQWLDGVPRFIAGGTGADTNFLPQSTLKAAAFPVKWALGKGHSSSEFWFRDPRMLMIGVLGVTVLALWLSRRFRGPMPTRPEKTLTIFWMVSILIWIKTFAIQRYLVPVELLTGVVLMIGLRHLVADRALALVGFAVVAAVAIAWTRAPNYGNVPFRKRMIPTAELRPLYLPNALYVMVGSEPMGYVVPALPQDARFVRIDGNMPLDPRKGLGRLVAAIIAEHHGPILELAPGNLTIAGSAALIKFGLAPTTTCRFAEGYGQHLKACVVNRRAV
jgi:hypothetical protein